MLKMMTLSSLETLGITCAYTGRSPLAHICNRSLDTGIFLSRLKFSVVRPIFKKGDNSIMSIWFRTFAVF